MFWSSRKTTDLSFRFENVYIHPTAEIGQDVDIGPFTYIGPNCRIGDRCRLHNNVTLAANVLMGEENEIFPSAVIGAEPQDKKYEGEESWVRMGDRNTVRECVTINAGTKLGGGETVIGSNNLLMASAHVAHDCILEDHITLANNVLLGGHVRVERHASFGGLAAVHHFVSVGQYAFVGGMARVTQDVPSFMLVEGNPVRVWSINKVGLKRNGVTPDAMRALKESHRMIFRSRGDRHQSLNKALAQHGSVAEVKALVEFLRKSEEGNRGRAREPHR